MQCDLGNSGDLQQQALENYPLVSLLSVTLASIFWLMSTIICIFATCFKIAVYKTWCTVKRETSGGKKKNQFRISQRL